jgi:hypothetical protein
MRSALPGTFSRVSASSFATTSPSIVCDMMAGVVSGSDRRDRDRDKREIPCKDLPQRRLFTFHFTYTCSHINECKLKYDTEIMGSLEAGPRNQCNSFCNTA